jgi:hypothetical protein
MLIGYIRVSKSDGSQVLDLQQDALVDTGVDPHRIYQDLSSGRKDDRPGLRACLKALQPGNTLVVWKLDRLGRDLKHLINTVDDLNKRGVGFKVLAGAGAQIDTTTANGRLIFGIFAALAEVESELIRERTKAGQGAGTIGRSAAKDDCGNLEDGHGRHGGSEFKIVRGGQTTRYHNNNSVCLCKRRWFLKGAWSASAG